MTVVVPESRGTHQHCADVVGAGTPTQPATGDPSATKVTVPGVETVAITSTGIALTTRSPLSTVTRAVDDAGATDTAMAGERLVAQSDDEGARLALKDWAPTPGGVHVQVALVVAATATHPAMATPLSSKVTVPGVETVAVSCSAVP